MPDSCSPDFVKQLADVVLGQVGIRTAEYNQKTHCSLKKPPPFRIIDIVAM
jgi:hypothetical protein